MNRLSACQRRYGWICLRTNQHFTQRERTLKRADPDGFVQYFHPKNRHECAVSERFRCFQYDELLKREKFKQTGRLLA
jgi:hypothetical protein